MTDKDDMFEFDNAPDLTPKDLEEMDGVAKLDNADAKKLISEAFTHENINVTDNKPSHITITNWFVMHECRHFGEKGQDIVQDIYEASVMHYNPFDHDDTSEVLGFDGSDAQKWQGTIKGLCGGDHYRLVNGQYESYAPDMIGGYDLSSPEKITDAVTDVITRHNKKHPVRLGTALYAIDTLDKLAGVKDYMQKHKSRFRLVLSTKKAEYLENALEQSHWTLKKSLNRDEETAFSKLPWEQQEEQLERLNKTLDFVLEGEEVAGKDKKIHLRCHAIYKGMESFQKQLDLKQRNAIICTL